MSLETIYWVKTTISLSQLKNKIILDFVKFVDTKNLRQQIFSPPLLFLLLDPGYEILAKHPGSATL
jgi:hypothetical protein